MRESKTLSFQVKATGITTNEQGQQVGKIEAFGAIYNNVDDGNDRILPGAFTRTAKNSKSRADARNNPYVLKMLWQHDTHELIGGWYELDTDNPKGLRSLGDVLLATQRGLEYYELAKAGMSDEFSIIYDIPAGGAKYDKSGVRDLTEIRLFSIDPVTFGMNDQTYTVGVKSRKGQPMKKDFDTLLQATRAEDCLEDWGDLINTLSQTMIQVFGMGDQPAPDMSVALEQFGTAVKDWEAKAIECNLAGYVAEQGYCSSMFGGNGTPMIPSSLRVGYMSRNSADMNTKAGRAISAATQQIVDDHVANLKALATAHTKAIRTAADDFASTIQGAEPTYASPNAGTPDDQEGKQATLGTSPHQEARSTPAHSSHKSDTAAELEDEIVNALGSIRALKLVKS
jgi:HK97 family phage prohead protease